MTQEHMELLCRLKNRFESCYDEYLREVMELDKEKIIESVSEILAAKEVHMEICFWLGLSTNKGDRLNIFMEPMSERDANYLLSQDNPLKMLAGKWWFHTIGGKPDFKGFYQKEIKIKPSALQ